jgi:hypothetical protein
LGKNLSASIFRRSRLEVRARGGGDVRRTSAGSAGGGSAGLRSRRHGPIARIRGGGDDGKIRLANQIMQFVQCPRNAAPPRRARADAAENRFASA